MLTTKFNVLDRRKKLANIRNKTSNSPVKDILITSTQKNKLQENINNEKVSGLPRIKKIWKDKLTPSQLDELTIELVKKLNVVTNKGKNLTHFWNPNLKKTYDRLWLPTKLSPGSLVVSSSKDLHEGLSNSWFSIEEKNKLEKSNSLPKFILPESTISQLIDDELLEIPQKTATKGKAAKGGVKCLKIRIFPNKKQIEKIHKIHEQSRWFYNAAITICYNHFDKIEEIESLQEYEIRDIVCKYRYVLTEESLRNDNGIPTTLIYKSFEYDEDYKGWPIFPGNEKVNKRVPRGAVISFVRSLKSAISNCNAGNIEKFNMRYKSKNCPIQTTLFEDSGFPKFLLNEMDSKYCITSSENRRINGGLKVGKGRPSLSFKEIYNADKHKSGFILEYDSLTDKHYILYTVPISWTPNIGCNNQTFVKEERPRIISLDPGVRTFLAGYDPTGKTITIGDKANEELYKLLQCIDDLNAKKAENKSSVSRRDLSLLYRKMQNLVRDLHWKASKYLTSNWNVIILPHFRTSKMLRGNRISKQTKRQMQAFSFFQFKQRISYQCKKRDRHLVLVEEDYTSKTCGRCGKLNKNLGGLKVFQCENCNLTIDRDLNGARNIFLKNLKAVIA
jgi:IS605 OrfB family transposase